MRRTRPGSRVAGPHGAAFDAFAGGYESALGRGLSATGDGPTYFAVERIRWTARCLRPLGATPRIVMDFGCGIGATCPLLLELLDAATVLGMDPSARSLERAIRAYGSGRIQFLLPSHFIPRADVDLVYCNGVFHHIAPVERAGVTSSILEMLRPGGIFAFWENNPWNPGTRYVMSRIAFDRGTQLLSPTGARRMLASCGFRVLRTDFLFYFPRWLAALRWLDPRLVRLPFGGQYLVLCQKP